MWSHFRNNEATGSKAKGQIMNNVLQYKLCKLLKNDEWISREQVRDYLGRVRRKENKVRTDLNKLKSMFKITGNDETVLQKYPNILELQLKTEAAWLTSGQGKSEVQGYTPAPEHSRSSIGVRKYIATNDRQASSVQAAGTSSESVKVNNQYEKLGSDENIVVYIDGGSQQQEKIDEIAIAAVENPGRNRAGDDAPRPVFPYSDGRPMHQESLVSSEPTKFDNSSFDNSLETPIQVGEKWHSTPKTVKRLLMSSEKKKAKKKK